MIETDELHSRQKKKVRENNMGGTLLIEKQEGQSSSKKEAKKEEGKEEEKLQKEGRSRTTNRFLSSLENRGNGGGNIFKKSSRDILRADYIPQELPHREKELNQIVSILSTGMEGGVPSNIFIYGTTGTGKTAVVLNVKRQLVEVESYLMERRLRPMRVLHVNCRLFDTKYALLSRIGNLLSTTETIPSGWPTERVYNQLVKNIEAEEATIILALDEVNALLEKSGDEALYHLSRINQDLNKSRLTIISITNNPNIWSILNPSVRSTLTPEDVYFESYNAEQLRDILEERARKAFNDEVLDDGVIPKCAAIAAQEKGDARIALELLRKAGEIAEREGAKKVTEDHVSKANKAIETNKVVSVIRGLPFHSKAVLLSIYAHMRDGFRKVSTGEVYDVYSMVCDECGKSPLTQRRVSDLISELDMLGIARSLVISKGRYGRTKEIRLAASLADVREGLQYSEDFRHLLEIKVRQRRI